MECAALIDGVNTAAELVKQGLAQPIAFSERGKGRKKEIVATKVRISDEGHALLGKQLREAAERNGPLRGERLKALFDRPRGDGVSQ